MTTMQFVLTKPCPFILGVELPHPLQLPHTMDINTHMYETPLTAKNCIKIELFSHSLMFARELISSESAMKLAHQ